MIKERIDSLKNLFIKYGVDGYIIPSNDKYMSEYVPLYAKRLEYITGFTGSNGIVIIYKDTALFFTDGRYLEQANKELDPEFFNIFDLKDYIDKEAKIGYDPELFTYSTISNLKFNLQKINSNLVDKIWHNQPPEPNSKVYLHDTKFAGISHSQKIKKCRELLKYYNKHNYALIILDSSSICWLLNLRANDVTYTPLMFAKVIITPIRLYLFIDPLRVNSEIVKVRSKITILPEAEFENILKNYDNILVDESALSVYIMDLIANKKVQKIVDPCLMLKACKNKVEIKHAIDFHIKDAVALCEFLADLEYSYHYCSDVITEYSLGIKLTRYRAQQEGYVSDSFPAICGFRENSAIIHYRADPKIAKEITGHDGILLIDSGAQYQGATTDITRTFVIGTATYEQKKRYTQVLKGHIALSIVKFPKNTVTGGNLDILARQYLWQETQDYPHSTGHGVGSFLSVHEGPQSINLHNKIVLQPGMILSNEPGFYVSGEYGIRIENLMYVKEKGGWLEFEALSLVPYSKGLIDIKLLNSNEINYIKKYYNKIKSKIYNLLSPQAQNWFNNEINLFL